MEKTAMQKMIEQLEDKRYKVFGNLAILAFEKAIDIAKSLLQEERQQIEQAVFDTMYSADPDDNYIEMYDDKASEYYESNYGK